MARYGFYRGWKCPRCDGDTAVFSGPANEQYGWRCPRTDCHAVGFGFRSRRSARIGLQEYREQYATQHREYR